MNSVINSHYDYSGYNIIVMQILIFFLDKTIQIELGFLWQGFILPVSKRIYTCSSVSYFSLFSYNLS